MFKRKWVMSLTDKKRLSNVVRWALGVCIGLTGMAAALAGDVVGVDPNFSALIARCAPTVHPETMAAVISAESRGHQFAIADAGPVKMPWAQRKALVRSHYPQSLESAISLASQLISDGHTVSLGLAQINDRNLKGLGVSIRDVFDPCTNLGAGGKILTEFYVRASRKFGPGARALRAAISGYNSGDWVRGENDGYVGLVYKQVGRPLTMRSVSVVSSISATPSRKLPTKIISNERSFAMTAGGFVVE